MAFYKSGYFTVLYTECTVYTYCTVVTQYQYKEELAVSDRKKDIKNAVTMTTLNYTRLHTVFARQWAL